MTNVKEMIWRWRRFLMASGIILALVGGLQVTLPRLVTERVVVAKTEIAAGDTISERQLAFREIPLQTLGSDRFRSAKPIIGKQSALRIPAGTVLISSMLQGPNQLAPKQENQAIIAVNVAATDYALVRPGSKVQFFLSHPAEAAGTNAPASGGGAEAGGSTGGGVESAAGLGKASSDNAKTLKTAPKNGDTDNSAQAADPLNSNNQIKPDLITKSDSAFGKLAIPATVLSSVKIEKGLTTSEKSYLVVAVEKTYAAMLLQENQENTLRLAVY